jgi:hypothetical protein
VLAAGNQSFCFNSPFRRKYGAPPTYTALLAGVLKPDANTFACRFTVGCGGTDKKGDYVPCNERSRIELLGKCAERDVPRLQVGKNARCKIQAAETAHRNNDEHITRHRLG